MFYNLSTCSSESLFKRWITCIKMIWGVPRSSFIYFGENTLANDFVSLQHHVYGRYINCFQGLFKSSSNELRHLARIVSRDTRSSKRRNRSLPTRETGLSPWDLSKWRMQENFRRATVPANGG